MTEHDNFIFNLARKQTRIKEAIREYKKQYLSDTASAPLKRGQKHDSGSTLKAKLLPKK
jgi:hypothetical protein